MLKGSIVALVTPMYEDESVNYEELERLIEYHIANKTDGIVVLGTTGEGTTLTDEEKEEIVRFTVEKVQGRIPVIAGSGSNSTAKAVALSKKFEALGADYLLVITPYYNKANEGGLYNHFITVAESVNTPIILYNVPGRTGVCISVDNVRKLSQHPNICAIKEASGDISYVMKISRYLSEDFALLSGNDDMIVPLLSCGASGVISVWANIQPEIVHNLVAYWLGGNVGKSLQIQQEYLDIANGLFVEVNPVPVKQCMNWLGFKTGPLRLPLENMSPANEEKLRNILKAYNMEVK